MTQPRVIFVFGSNLAGVHAGGAAAEARRWWGAIDGRGVGHLGESYAIPTVDADWHRLPLDAIARHVNTFKLYAEGSPELTFYVTPIGCGIAGYTAESIAPLFTGAPSNVQLPAGWRTERCVMAIPANRGDQRDERSFIWTYSGRQVWPLDARVDEISVDDIAHALSNICRFTGHTRSFYSVAQHSVLVMEHCAVTTSDPSVLLDALLHDATEAYLNDLARPVKYQPHLDRYREAEAALDAVIRSRFSLPPEMSELVKEADDALLAGEIRDLMHSPPPAWVERANRARVPTVMPVAPTVAKAFFLEAFSRLNFQRNRRSDNDPGQVVCS